MKTATEKKEIKTEADVAYILSGRYTSPEWVFMTRVRNQTGFTRDIRTADALAMNTYPSRGFEVNGFEIKVSKSDLMHELKQPEKSAEIQQFCHKWWLVINDPKFIEGLHIPITWGVIDVSKGKCVVLVKAPDLKPKPMTPEFVASLLRNTTEGFLTPTQVANRVEVAQANAIHKMDREYRQLKELEQSVKDFQKESGIIIRDGWHKGEAIGKAVNFVLEGKRRMKYEAESIKRNAESVIAQADLMLKEL